MLIFFTSLHRLCLKYLPGLLQMNEFCVVLLSLGVQQADRAEAAHL